MTRAIRAGAVAVLLIASGGLAFTAFAPDFKADVEEQSRPVAVVATTRVDSKPKQQAAVQARVRRELEAQGMRVRTASVVNMQTPAEFAALKSRAINGEDAAVETLHVSIGACASSLARTPLDIEASKRALSAAGATQQAFRDIVSSANALRAECAGVPQWMVSDLDSIYVQAMDTGSLSAAYRLYEK